MSLLARFPALLTLLETRGGLSLEASKVLQRAFRPSAGAMAANESTSLHAGPGQAERAIPAAEKLSEIEQAPEARERILVIGGSGFVGSHVVKEAVAKGLKVASLNRSGRPAISESWVDKVEWIPGSVFEPASWRSHLKDVQGVITCVGGFGSYATMKKICGDANIVAAETAAAEGVKRFVFISAADLGLPSFILRGYFEGKREAEEAVHQHFPYGGVILRPAFIHGTRRVGGFGVPLQLVGAPMEMALRSPLLKWSTQLPLVGPLLTPPIKASSLAKVAVRAATDNVVPPGILDVWQIERMAEKEARVRK